MHLALVSAAELVPCFVPMFCTIEYRCISWYIMPGSSAVDTAEEADAQAAADILIQDKNEDKR